ncbi:hypothetical protein ACWEWX_25000 [Streptomyces asiaticus]
MAEDDPTDERGHVQIVEQMGVALGEGTDDQIGHGIPSRRVMRSRSDAIAADA